MKNILLLDAELTWLACVREALITKGYNVVTLPGSGMLNEYLRLQVPDLVVLHVRTFSYNLQRVFALLKGTSDYRHIPVILIPQDELSNDELSQIEVDECMPGSFNMATLLTKCERLLQGAATSLNTLPVAPVGPGFELTVR